MIRCKIAKYCRQSLHNTNVLWLWPLSARKTLKMFDQNIFTVNPVRLLYVSFFVANCLIYRNFIFTSTLSYHKLHKKFFVDTKETNKEINKIQQHEFQRFHMYKFLLSIKQRIFLKTFQTLLKKPSSRMFLDLYYVWLSHDPPMSCIWSIFF